MEETDSRASGEVGVSRRFGVLEPYAHVGTGFRAPNLDERYFNGYIHGGLRIFGNADLESEHSLSYETGLRVSNEGSWLRGARLSVYQSNVEDMITFVYVGMVRLVPHFEYQNVHRARLRGIEGTAQLRLGKAFVDLSAGYPQGEDLDTGKRLEDLGPPRATFELLYPIPRLLPQGTFSTRVRWSDAVTDVSEPLLRPAFSTTALEVGSTVAGVRASFAIRNLFDHYYYEPQSFIPEPGRTYAFSIRREFRASWPL
jgi:hemoglobin/transferrin/lactoferrin receptor protein